MAPNWDPDLVTGLAAILARKWTVSVLAALWDGPLRRNVLNERLAPASPKVLTRALRALEHEGLIERQVVGDLPLRVHYALTTKAKALDLVLRTMTEWAATAHPATERGSSHKHH